MSVSLMDLANNPSTKLLNPSDEEAQEIRLSNEAEESVKQKELPKITTDMLGVGKHVWKRILLLMKAGYRRPFSPVALFTYFLLATAILTNLTQQWFVSLPKIFQSALKDNDEPSFKAALLQCILYVCILFIGNGTFKLVAGIVRVQLREGISLKLHGICLRNNIYYRTVVLDKLVDNPDERIVRDVDNWTQNWMSIIDKLVNCSLSVALMTGVNFGSMGILALVPTGILLVSAFISVLLVRRVIPRVFKQQLLEGDFRFSHMRIRENVESLAFCGPSAEAKEHSFLDKALSRVVKNRISVYLGYYPLDLINELLKYGGKMLGFLVVGISYFYGGGGSAQIGDLITSVFATENLMLNLQEIVQLVENFGDVAGYTARVAEVLELTRLDGSGHTEVNETEGEYLVSDATISAPSGRILFKNLELTLKEGNLLIRGPNGSGKTSLLRCLAGIWPCREGVLSKPKGAYFMPQKPFLSQSYGMSLRDLVSYPQVILPDEDSRVLKALQSVGLVELVKWRNLDDFDNWEAVLSPGEKQSVVFARMLFHHPSHVLMDEATSAMSRENEKICFNALKERNISFVAISHNTEVIAFCDFELVVEENGTWSFNRL